ncbi:MAG: rod shape-determining protein MreD [Lachnospiraceae bacterium]|nr:rod shape-determining protein MreD [Lachnospiraceae bacterium]MDD5854627.1 rod shape-determining protein MreD [Lachnospiraceae bacterium]
MKNFLLSAILIVASFILQNTVCGYISFGDIVPNLLLITVSSFGFIKGKKAGVLAGFFAGILVDIYFSQIIGFHALLYMYIGYFNGFFKRLFYKDELKLQILLVGCSDFVYGLFYYLLTFLLRGRFHFTYYLINIIIPETVYTILMTIVIFLIKTLFQKFFISEDRKSKHEIV